MKKAAIIGYPACHSLSPVIHGYWLKKHQIAGEYGILETLPEALEQTFLSLAERGYSGINVTVPFKERVFSYLNNIDEMATQIGAVNTVTFDAQGKSYGTNTDAYGFIQGIKAAVKNVSFQEKTVIVFGAGGAARAVLYGLLEAGVGKVILQNRTPQKARILQDIFGNKIDIVSEWKDTMLQEADFLVNTTTLGMQGQGALEIDLNYLPKKAIVVDIVYKPLCTNLLEGAQQNGNTTVDGLWMLLYQAVRGFELFFGTQPEVTQELREHVLQHIKGV